MIDPITATGTSERVSAGCARAPVTHELKCWPQFFQAIAEGRKRHDLRRLRERSFEVGDHLTLLEFDPEKNRYTGRRQEVEITFITSADQPCALSESALHEDFCILSIALIARN